MTACACSLLLLVSFALFAQNQISVGSKHQQALLVASTAGSPAPAPHPKGHSRRFIDGAASALTSPFHSIVASDSDWVSHGIPTIFALVAFGGGLGFMSRYCRGVA